MALPVSRVTLAATVLILIGFVGAFLSGSAFAVGFACFVAGFIAAGWADGIAEHIARGYDP